MTIFYEIPLIAGFSDQTADITLDDLPYTIRVLWNERFGYWSLSINERDGEPILTNIKMVAMYPLVKRYKRLKMRGELYFVHRGGKTYRPGFDDVGGEYGLFYYWDEVAPSYPKPIAPRV